MTFAFSVLSVAFQRHPLPIPDTLCLPLPLRARRAVAPGVSQLKIAHKVFREHGRHDSADVTWMRSVIRKEWLESSELGCPLTDTERRLFPSDTQAPERFRMNDSASRVRTLMCELFDALSASSGSKCVSHELVKYRGGAQVDVSPHDLFHAHVFACEHGLGVLFHIAEYPRFSNASFPWNLGFCQKGSTLIPTPTMMHVRNVMWHDTRPCNLVVPLIRPGAKWEALASPGSLATVYEGDLGVPLFEVFRFPQRPELLAYSYR
ncbi:hypothetical protein FVE85_8229 [Porphyridium purpureum]|uniref:Uncharacterized protein n=1 Tax=Porphyridium purpureum TaxID=35688 RepID=A0A5J4YMV8_PORPP|nr:hypothetical protein FVE85_8229 [Porphyridium purpureum]|eukprot:POR3521..scf244_11